MIPPNIENEISLLDTEEVAIEVLENENGKEFSNEEINQKYTRGETRIVTEQARYPLNTILGMVESKNYILNPEYQRRHRWSQEKKSRLIESFIINVPLPPIFLYEVDYSIYEVMDGLQRLTAISQFYKNEFALEGLTEWVELNGKTYKNLPEKVRRGIDRRYLSSIILLQETSQSDKGKEEFLKQLVFERLNSGGEKLTPQETRNALYNGKFNKLCIQLSRNEDFCKLWHIPLPTREELDNGILEPDLITHPLFENMGDVELVLRYFAYRQLPKMNKFSSIERFLDQYLKTANQFSNETLVSLRAEFEKTIGFVFEILGENAFISRKRGSRNSPSKILFDCIMYVFTGLLSEKQKLLENKSAIESGLMGFFEKYADEFNSRNNNRNDVIRRINLFSEFFGQFLK